MFRRWTFNIISAISALFCVTTLAAWAVSEQSHFAPDGYATVAGVTLNLQDGWIALSNPRKPWFVVPRFGIALNVPLQGEIQWRGPGLCFIRFTWPPQCPLGTYWVAAVSPVYPLMLTAILPIVWLIRRMRGSGNTKRNVCSTCGYNLTGNTSGVCPECGIMIVQN